MDHHNHHFLVVLFGRPGAGKTTIAEHVLRQLPCFCSFSQQLQDQHEQQRLQFNQHHQYDECQQVSVSAMNVICCCQCQLGLDLDVCVPTWMRDNFVKGIYPTIQERHAFALDLCQHVHRSIQQHDLHQQTLNNITQSETTTTTQIQNVAVVISFSFVNVDLRQVFRDQFPAAHWILVDTPEATAQERIEQRQGHFYTGNRKITSNLTIRNSSTGDITTSTATGIQLAQQSHDNASDVTISSKSRATREVLRGGDDSDVNNRDWIFAPVDFPHIVLNGCNSASENAQKVVKLVCEHVCKGAVK